MFQEQNKPLRAFEVGSWGGEFNPECGSQKGNVVIKEHWGQSGFANTAHAARGPENHAGLFWPVVVGLGGGPPAQLTTSTLASGASHLAGKAMSHAPDPELKQEAEWPFLSHRGAFSSFCQDASVRLSVPPQHQLVGLRGRHKKVPYLSVGISITMILRSRSQLGGSDECAGPQDGS